MSTTEEFRAETKAWLEENCPESMRARMPEEETVWGGRNPTFPSTDAKRWMEAMAKQGWTAPTWPQEYCGGGLSRSENNILQEELRRINARQALSSFGIWMLGPALLEFASEQQKQEFLPPIVRGEIRWCQGYSEPGAGSDLASLQTKAEDKGNHFLVNGSKIWTSYADQADWIFCLVRTDFDAPKHQGISFLLFDMAAEGVSTSPIRLISGASPFCQTFFDNVKVPKHNLIGEPNKGWSIAKRLLQHERNMISNMGGNSALGGSRRSVAQLAEPYLGTTDEGELADPILRDKIAAHEMNDKAFQLTLLRAQEEAAAGNNNQHWSSLFKYYGSEQNKRKYELMLDIMGSRALGWGGAGFSDTELQTTRQWLRSKANSIEGGTSEVQLNVIAKRVLELPD